MLRILFLTLLLSPLLVLTYPTLPCTPIHQIYQFADGSFVENIAVRSNGQLLLTTLTSPTLYTLDPTAHDISAKLVATFPNANGVSGIAETSPDVFAVSAGVWNMSSYRGEEGSFAVWSVDMRGPDPVVKKIALILGTTVLNGMATIEGSPNIVLLSDSALGAIWSLDIVTGTSSIVIQDPLLEPTDTPASLGINGIKTRGRTLYFTNSATGTFGHLSITDNGEASGAIEVVARESDVQTAYDDFALDVQLNAFIANHPDEVVQVTNLGGQTVITDSQNITKFTQPTSAAFGRGNGNEASTLYVTTGGGQVIAIQAC